MCRTKPAICNKLVLTILFLTLCTHHSSSQSLNHLKAINKEWAKFYQAFDALDYRLMAEIHSKRLIRISGGQRIRDYETYINNYKDQFKNAKEKGISNQIALRFFERINNDSIASERGIYKLMRTEQGQDQKAYYGQFHVLWIKEQGAWKILMDYDSNEGNAINEEDFRKAYGIGEFDPFILQ